MKENYSIADLVEKYKKISLDGNNFEKNYDFTFFANFFKDINCDEYFFRERATLNLDNPDFERLRYASLIENGAQLACLDRDNIMLRSKDKRLKLSTKEYNDGVYNDVVSMYHSTPQGIYFFNVRAYCLNGKTRNYVYDFAYTPVEPENQINVGVNIPWVFLTDENTIARYKSFEMEKVDISKLANKIYCEGLVVLYERLKNGETIESLLGDGIAYQAESSEITKLAEIPNLEKQEDDEKVIEINQVVDVLLYLREKGIELSDEQRNIISLYN